ncbi:MAG TPA: PKD domain-containing protein [Thermoanaerobaculia bacterium]|nr:PKD domain-containing protein [Thermoanaerobaculia bacterium]
MRSRILALTAALVALGLTACDSATPVAPTGAMLKLSITPVEIALNGSATVTVEARRENGQPVNQGSEITLSTTLGRLDATVLFTDERGFATTTLRGDGRIGEASVVARSGAVESTAVMVQIGRLASNVTLQTSPTTIPETEDATVNLLAVVRDGQGQPLPNVSVNFLTDVGQLNSGGAFRTTDNRGEAKDTLRVSTEDVNVLSGETFTVRVQVSASGGNVASDDATITIARRPIASFTVQQNRLIVTFTDTSTGGRPTEWFWDFDFAGVPNVSTSRLQNPTFTYSAPGTYVVFFRATNATGSGETTRQITVTAN